MSGSKRAEAMAAASSANKAAEFSLVAAQRSVKQWSKEPPTSPEKKRVVSMIQTQVDLH